jgi:hypothetical protein
LPVLLQRPRVLTAALSAAAAARGVSLLALDPGSTPEQWREAGVDVLVHKVPDEPGGSAHGGGGGHITSCQQQLLLLQTFTAAARGMNPGPTHPPTHSLTHPFVSPIMVQAEAVYTRWWCCGGTVLVWVLVFYFAVHVSVVHAQDLMSGWTLGQQQQQQQETRASARLQQCCWTLHRQSGACRTGRPCWHH